MEKILDSDGSVISDESDSIYDNSANKSSPPPSMNKQQIKSRIKPRYDPNTKIDEIIVQHYTRKDLYH